MLGGMFRKTLGTPHVRILLALFLILAGLSPLGMAVLSDSNVRQLRQETRPPAVETPIVYRWENTDGGSRVLRSENSGQTWEPAGGLPDAILDLKTLDAGASAYAHSKAGIWRSEDAGATWTPAAALPSQATALGLSPSGLLYAGTESMGLLRSADGGRSWQTVALPGSDLGALSVTALAASETDPQTVFVSAGHWLGTSARRLTPAGTYLSVDAGEHWFTLESAQPGAALVEHLVTLEGQPLAVALGVDSAATRTLAPAVAATAGPALEQTDAGLRTAAIRLIALSGQRDLVPALLGHMDESNPRAAQILAETLAKLGDESTDTALMAALQSDDLNSRALAAYTLGLRGSEAGVTELSLMLRSDNDLIRRRAAEGLAAIGTEEAVAALAGPLMDEQITPARQSAMAALEQVGDPAVPHLQKLLRNSQPVVRRNAAEMLGWIRSPLAVEALGKSLRDDDPQVRAESAWALSEIATPASQQILALAAKSEKDAAVSQTLAMALERTDAVVPANAAAAEAAPHTTFMTVLKALADLPAASWTFSAVALLLAMLLLIVRPAGQAPTMVFPGRR